MAAFVPAASFASVAPSTSATFSSDACAQGRVTKATLFSVGKPKLASFTGFRPSQNVEDVTFAAEGRSFAVKASANGAEEAKPAKKINHNVAAALALAACATSTALFNPQPVNAETVTYDEIRQQTYLTLKGTGLANQCPGLGTSARGTIPIEKGKSYYVTDLCLQPTTIVVKAEGTIKGAAPEFQKTRLMTRQTYTIDSVEGPVFVDNDGKITFEEKDGFDYQALTVKLPGGELVPMLFTIKDLVAKADSSSGAVTPATEFVGDFNVPSYRGGTFLDPKGRGFASGYDFAVGLPATNNDEIAKENDKSTDITKGNISLQVVRVDGATGEIAGVFESKQLSDTDLGAKVGKDIKLTGVFYARINEGGNPNAL